MSGATFIFRVKARNEIGYGPYSDTIEIVAASRPKSPPANLVRNDELTGKDSVTFSWTTPDDDGGLSVSDYTVEMKKVQKESNDDEGFTVVSAN